MYRHVFASIGLAACLAVASVQPGLAQDHHGGGSEHGGGGSEHGGGHGWEEHRGGHASGHGRYYGGIGAWHGGGWNHGWHNGRFGWWWVVPGWADWYYYNAPIYPAPDPYLPPGMAVGPTPYWYFCSNPQGYYPYVQQCFGPWRPVPPQAVPPQPPG
jgi:hypothetical protein